MNRRAPAPNDIKDDVQFFEGRSRSPNNAPSGSETALMPPHMNAFRGVANSIGLVSYSLRTMSMQKTAAMISIRRGSSAETESAISKT